MADILVRDEEDEGVIKRYRDQGDGTYALVATLPASLVTGTIGRAQRLRVDPGQTGFFDGRMFRSFTEQVIPVAGPSVQFRFTSPGVYFGRFSTLTGGVALTDSAQMLYTIYWEERP